MVQDALGNDHETPERAAGSAWSDGFGSAWAESWLAEIKGQTARAGRLSRCAKWALHHLTTACNSAHVSAPVLECDSSLLRIRTAIWAARV